MSKEKATNHYLKYTGQAFQMAGILAIGIFLGKYLDKMYGFEKPIVTLVLTLLLFTGIMYKLIIELNKQK